MIPLRRGGAIFVAALLGAGAGHAQSAARQQDRSRDCELLMRGVSIGGVITTHFQSTQTVAGNSNVFAGGGVDGVCANSDQRVRSDSAEQWGDARLVHLIGRVHYTEKRVQLDADRITYYMGEERLIAEGNVVGRTETGTTFKGPRAVYLRAKVGLRDRSRLDAGGWHSRAYAGEPLPTLDAVAAYMRANGFALNIEIKPTPGVELHTGRVVAEHAARL